MAGFGPPFLYEKFQMNITSTEQAIETIKSTVAWLQHEYPVTAADLAEAGLWLASDIERLREIEFRMEGLDK